MKMAKVETSATAVEKQMAETKAPSQPNPVSRLKFFVTIVDHNHHKEVLKILRTHESGLGFITHGRGTGTKEIYDLLGLSDVRKDIIFAVIRSNQVDNVKKEVASYFKKESRGIAFAIDISSVIGTSIYKYLSNTRV